MKKEKKCVLVVSLFFGISIFLGLAQQGIAADYPNRPIKLIIGHTQGGFADFNARLYSEKASEFLGQPIVCENKIGGGSTIAAMAVLNAKPDGYTLMLGTQSSVLLAPITVPNAGYKMEDFIPICGYADTIGLLIVKKGRWNTLPEFIQDAKKNPGKYTAAISGSLSATHFMLVAFAKKAGIQLTIVPYPGTAESNTAVLGGHADITFAGPSAPVIEGSTLTALATSYEKRVKEFPGVPTLIELGIPLAGSAFNFLAAPKNTPQSVIDILYDANKKAVAKYGAEINDKIGKFLALPYFCGPEEVMRINDRDYKVLYETAKEMGVLTK